MIIFYILVLLALSVYSYVAIETGPKLFAQPVVLTGTLSSIVYFVLVTFLFVMHLRIMKRAKSAPLKTLAIISAALLLFSYPFISRDIFNYMFYAKILTFYHQNPFIVAPAQFAGDPLLPLVILPHKTTFYGPSFVALSAIPSLLSFGNTLVAYLLYKIMNAGFYLLGVYILAKWKKEWAVFFATSPLVLVEGLVNMHNDLISLTIALTGLYYVFHKSDTYGRVLLLFSGLLKYSTLSLGLISKDKRNILNVIAFAGIGLVLAYATFLRGMSTWYLLILFTLIPFRFETLKKYQFFYFGSLLGYVYFIEHGDWRLSFMYLMIFGSLVLNFIYNTTNEFFLGRTKKK